jgi:hypothetical protein
MGDVAHQRIMVTISDALHSRPGPRVAIRDAKEDRNGPVTQFRAGIRGKHLDEVRYHVRGTQLVGPAGLARDRMQRRAADQLDGIA